MKSLLLFSVMAVAHPPLTPAEMTLVKQYRKEAEIVRRQKEIAEKATVAFFGRNEKGDESDAYRHYVWASLLVVELGKPLAERFLNAHEAGSGNPGPEEKMDRENNALAVRETVNALKKKKPTLAEIEGAALSALLGNRLEVISPRGIPRRFHLKMPTQRADP